MSEKHVTVWVQNFGDRPYPVLQWHDPDTGKRKSKSAESCNPIDVERRRAALEYELNHGLYREASGMSWGRFRQLYEAEYLTHRRPNTRRNHRAALDLFGRLCNPGTLRSVTERTVSAFAASMRGVDVPGRGRGMKDSTIHAYLRVLRAALNWAAHQRLLPECPKFPRVKAPRKRPQPIPPESFERIMDKAGDQQTRAYLLTGWLAGLRLREAFEMEWHPNDVYPWVDLARDRVVLPAATAKAVEDQWVPLDPALREALEALPRHGRKVFQFINRSGRPLTAGSLSKRIGALAHRAGVRLTMKELRKGFGCRYAGKVPAQVLQKLMRHAQISTTLDYYANLDAAVEEAVLGPGRNSSRNTGGSGQGGGGEELPFRREEAGQRGEERADTRL
jgi:integrase